MGQKNRIILTFLAILIIWPGLALSQEESVSFQAKITQDNINLRSDSTVSAEAICTLNKGERVEVISELYGWYKIKLPKCAPSYIKENLVIVIDEKTAKVAGNNVNIRLGPNEASPILGQAKENEIVNILSEHRDWYKIEPIDNSFGWVHKNFVNKIAKEDKPVKPVKPAKKGKR